MKKLNPAGPHRGYMKIRNSRQSGWTLIEIMLVVFLIGMLAAIMIPNMIHARNTSDEKACINNLRQINASAQTWAADNNKQSSDSYTLDDIKDYLQRDRIPQCPGGGQYGPTFTVGQPATCSVPGHVLQ